MSHPDVPGTALAPMFVLVVEQYTPTSQRVVDDALVASLLPRSLRVLNRLMAWAHWEVDLATNIDAKRASYGRALGGVPDNIRLVPTDFEAEAVGEVLSGAAFRLDQPALFVMEAVSQYLTDAAMRGLLGFLATAATGSRLIFTYVQKDFVDGTRDMGAASLRRRFVEKQPPLWTYALDPSDVGPLLADHRWTQREDLDPDEYRRRFIAPTGRELVVSDVEHYVGADKA